jgi:Protein of unknown function (DUF705)
VYFSKARSDLGLNLGNSNDLNRIQSKSMQDNNSPQQFYIYVDIDDTLVRSYGSKRIPIAATIAHIKELHQQGAILYCWSSGGAEYARNTAVELGILDIFESFLPKPQMLLDDQEVNDWRSLIQVHPLSCQSKNLDDYRYQLQEQLASDRY